MTDPSAADADADVVAAARRGRNRRAPGPPAAVPAAVPAAADDDPGAATLDHPGAATPDAEQVAAAAAAAALTGPGDPHGPVIDGGTVAASLPVVNRDTLTLLDPASQVGAVADLAPWASTTGNRDGYVRAPVDAHELIMPPNCTTPITRRAWSRGQWVRAEVYQAWGEQQPGGVPTPMPADTAAGHPDSRHVLDTNTGGFSAPVGF